MSEEPQVGQMRGVLLRLDPKGILFAPHTLNGVSWGYSIDPDEDNPAIYMDDEWKEIIPEGVWYQMVENWTQVKNTVLNNPKEYADYLAYPEFGGSNESD